ncbi:hypothetical protein PMAYCL1PPCAC_28560, partial [Pristionchus mayeri]
YSSSSPFPSHRPSIQPLLLLLPLPFLMLSSLSLLLLLCTGTTALRCFVTNDDGKAEIVDDPSWQLCSLVPFGGENEEGIQSGIGPQNQDLSPLLPLFADSSLVQTKVICTLEAYNISRLSPAFAHAEQETLFRCFCSRDLCNSASTFSAFLQVNGGH